MGTGCPYRYLDRGELEDHLARYDQFLQQAAAGDATVSDYRDVLPDRRFVDGVLPDQWLQETVIADVTEQALEEQFQEADSLGEFREYEEEITAQQSDTAQQYEIVLDQLKTDDRTVTIQGTDLAGEYLHMANHAEDPSRIRRYIGAIPRVITKKGYDRATPTGITVDELEEEQEQPGIVGRLTPSMGKTWAVLAGGVGMTATGASVGEPALMDAGTLTTYSTLPMMGSNLYHAGRDEQYEDAIAERTADMVEQEIGDYAVNVVESGPFRLLTEK